MRETNALSIIGSFFIIEFATDGFIFLYFPEFVHVGFTEFPKRPVNSPFCITNIKY